MIKIERLITFVKTNGKKITLKKNTMVFKGEEVPSHFYLLESGWVKVFQEAESGQAITLALFKAGDLFGLAELLARVNKRERYAASLMEITMYAVPAEQLMEYLEEYPELWQMLSRLMAERLINTQKYIKALTSLSVEERLGWFLQLFAVANKDGTYSIEVPLSHEEISYLINCSRQRITSNLNQWRNNGFILYERGHIDILQPNEVFPVL